MTKPTAKRAIVIGSGFGGLAAAIRLQTAGFQTQILEKRDLPGGRAYVYKQDGFTFDAGPTVITAPQCLEELFALSGRKMKDYVELRPVTPFYRLLWEDGSTFDYGGDLEKTIEQIRAFSPGDVDGYLRFLEYSREVFDEGYTKLSGAPFPNFWSMAKAGPKLARLRAYRSVYATVASHVRDERLREAFSFHSLLVGGNPFATSSIYALIHYLERKWGVFFPVGGTGALVRALVKLFEDLGGEILLDAELDQIVVRDGVATGARLRDGREFAADFVVSNADVVHTYQTLLRAEPRARPAIRWSRSKRQSMSLFVLYFGTNKRFENVAHHSVVFGPRYKGLLDEVFGRRKRLPDDFSLYLHAPCKTDPSLAPPGCESFYVLSPVGHLGNLPVDWRVEGPRYAKKIVAALERRCMPGLSEAIVTQRFFAPDDFKSELNSPVGSAFSFEPILRQSAWFRAANRCPWINNLYFVGAGTHPGAGVPGVVQSAKATMTTILEDHAHA